MHTELACCVKCRQISSGEPGQTIVSNPCYRCYLRAQGRLRAERMRVARSKGTHTESQWEELKAIHNHCCVICGLKKKLTKDHIIAVSKGGSDSITNIQPLCFSCNISKGNR